MRAELGLLGAMMLASAVPYSAAWITVSQTAKSEPGEEGINKAFVKNYADRMIKLTSDENYTNYLKVFNITYGWAQRNGSSNRAI